MRVITYGIPAVLAAGALGLAGCSGSPPSSGTPSARYYQEGYRYARASVSQSQYQILRHAGYAKWCADAKAATTELDNAPGGPPSKAGNQWVKGCSAYAAGDGLPASASRASAPPAGTSPPAPQPSPPASAPSSPANGSACRTVTGYYAGGQPGYWDSQQNVCIPNGAAPENPNPHTSPQAPSPSQPSPYCDPSTRICQQAPAPPPGGYPGGSQNPCNGPDASQFGDCVPGGGINGGSP
jgi:hypothetical protein